MRVHVRRYFNGHRLGYEFYRLPDYRGGRYTPAVSWLRLHGDDWSRGLASEARDVLQHVYGLTRSAIRFVHH